MIWERWKIIIETMLSIPRFQLVWEKTKLSRPGSEFRDFIDSFKKAMYRDLSLFV